MNVYLLLSSLILILSGCSGQSDLPDSSGTPSASSNNAVLVADIDKDGMANELDCAPNDAKAWRLARSYPDADADQVPDSLTENMQCIGASPLAQTTHTIASKPDNCLNLSNPTQVDLDLDQVGDACDPDIDGDSISNAQDCEALNPHLSIMATFYRDNDEDGYGNSADPLSQCSDLIVTAPSGYSLNGGDSNDSDESVTPLDADGDLTADTLDCAPSDASKFKITNFYVDADSDNYTENLTPFSVCAGNTVPSQYIAHQTALDNCPKQTNNQADFDKDLIGDTCDADIDNDQFANANDCQPSDANSFRLANLFADSDSDGVGVGTAINLCIGASNPTGYVASKTSDDNCPLVYNDDQANSDNDALGDVCDNDMDNDFVKNQSDCAPLDPLKFTWVSYFQDKDGDGYGSSSSLNVCENDALPAGYSRNSGDPDDSNAQKIPNDRDFDLVQDSSDCAPDDPTKKVSLGLYTDADEDGVGTNQFSNQCVENQSAPKGYVTLQGGYDCNDQNPKINSRLPEVANNNLDDDCDSYSDERVVDFPTDALSVLGRNYHYEMPGGVFGMGSNLNYDSHLGGNAHDLWRLDTLSNSFVRMPGNQGNDGGRGIYPVSQDHFLLTRAFKSSKSSYQHQAQIYRLLGDTLTKTHELSGSCSNPNKCDDSANIIKNFNRNGAVLPGSDKLFNLQPSNINTSKDFKVTFNPLVEGSMGAPVTNGNLNISALRKILLSECGIQKNVDFSVVGQIAVGPYIVAKISRVFLDCAGTNYLTEIRLMLIYNDESSELRPISNLIIPADASLINTGYKSTFVTRGSDNKFRLYKIVNGALVETASVKYIANEEGLRSDNQGIYPVMTHIIRSGVPYWPLPLAKTLQDPQIIQRLGFNLVSGNVEAFENQPARREADFDGKADLNIRDINATDRYTIYFDLALRKYRVFLFEQR